MAKPSKNVAALFKPVLEWLEAGAHHHTDDNRVIGFHMSHFNQNNMRDVNGLHCGTVHCIAGALKLFNPKVFARNSNIQAIAKKLGFSDSQRFVMFYAGYFVDEDLFTEMKDLDPHLDQEDTTPQMAADMIKRYLETGRVSWLDL